MRYFAGLKLGLAALALTGSMSAAVIFQDTFPDSGGPGVEEPQGFGIVTGTLDLLKWDVTDGSVDVLDTFQSLNCGAPSGKRCLDINGSNGVTGRIQSTPMFTFLAGNSYTLTFWLAGSGRTGTDSVRVSLGSLGSVDVTLASGAGWQIYTLGQFTGNGSTGRIVIDSTVFGGDSDNIGILVDDVSLLETVGAAADIPEPATVLLSLAGLAVLALRRR